MKEFIESFKEIIIQIATPYSTGGTGFYLKSHDLIVTNEHVVRGNREVVINGNKIKKQRARILFTDEKHDIAFIEAPKDINLVEVELDTSDNDYIGAQILALGHPFNLQYSFTQGIISSYFQQGDVTYIQHDAALNPGNSGGPLINKDGKIIGINTFIVKNGDNIGFSLPVSYLANTLEHYSDAHAIGTRCASCMNLVYEDETDLRYCPFCGAEIELPSQAEEYEPIGVSYTIEQMIKEIGHDVVLARSGPNVWEIYEGSANITISYHERSGIIIGDAYLCTLPSDDKNKIKNIYAYLLNQNHKIEGLTFSIKVQDIILSLLIQDRFLNLETGLELFKHLFEMADYHDNILVEEHGALWRN